MGRDEKLNRRRIVLDELDQDKSIDQEEYRVKVKEYQLRLLNLQRALMEKRRNVVVVVEGSGRCRQRRGDQASGRET